jgi:hypothetical protein
MPVCSSTSFLRSGNIEPKDYVVKEWPGCQSGIQLGPVATGTSAKEASGFDPVQIRF